LYTDKKEKLFPHIKGSYEGTGAKSNMTNGLLINMGKNLGISSYFRKPFLIYDFAPDPI
jgi:hypothetical protein